MGGIGIWQLLIVLMLVFLLFGTKRLRTLGSDLGETIKGFRSSMGNEEPKADETVAHKSTLSDANHTAQPHTESKH